MLTFLKYVFARKNLTSEGYHQDLTVLVVGLCSTTLNLTTDKTKRAHFFSLLDDWFGISVKGIQVISDLYFQ